MPSIASSAGDVEVGDARGGVGDDLRPGAVGAHPEDVLALQLEQVGDLVEHAGDARVLHGRDRTAVGPARKPLRRGRPRILRDNHHACRCETSVPTSASC